MAHFNTILNQITALFSRHDFEKLAKTYHVGLKFRSFNRWSSLLAMMIAQISDTFGGSYQQSIFQKTNVISGSQEL